MAYTMYKDLDVPKPVLVSGNVTVRRTTLSVITASGLALSNDLTYSGAAFSQFDTATFVVDYFGGGSGVIYRIRGHPITNTSPTIVGSGVITGSGSQTSHTVTGAFEYIDIGLANLQTNFSGFASAILARR